MRLWIVAGLMTACMLTTLWVRAGFEFEVVPLHEELSSIPMSLEDWVGADVAAIDANIVELLSAQATIDREYENRLGQTVQLSVSAWLRPETVADAAPHLPRLCYQNSGWSIVEEQEVSVSDGHQQYQLSVLLIEQGEQRMVAAYWYQIGHQPFTTVAQARSIHRELWGKPHWPATIKVHMQTPATDLEGGVSVIEKLAVPLARELDRVIGPAKS